MCRAHVADSTLQQHQQTWRSRGHTFVLAWQYHDTCRLLQAVVGRKVDGWGSSLRSKPRRQHLLHLHGAFVAGARCGTNSLQACIQRPGLVGAHGVAQLKQQQQLLWCRAGGLDKSLPAGRLAWAVHSKLLPSCCHFA